jgi:hypothetical protein
MNNPTDPGEKSARAKNRERPGEVFPVVAVLGFVVAALCLVFGTAHVGRTLKQNHDTIGVLRDSVRVLRDAAKELQDAEVKLAGENQVLRDSLRKRTGTLEPPVPKPPAPRPPKPRPTKPEPQGPDSIKHPTAPETIPSKPKSSIGNFKRY